MSAMEDYNAAMERQSSKPFEPHERQQIRYIVLERFWAGARYQQKARRLVSWLSASIATAVGIITAWEPITKLWEHLTTGAHP